MHLLAVLAFARRHRALALPLVLLLVAVGMVIVIQLHQLSTESYRRAARGTYGTLSEVLAQSAAEEAHYVLGRECNNPSDSTGIFGAFRSSNGTPGPITVDLPILRSKVADPLFEGYLTQRFDVNSAFTATLEVVFTHELGSRRVAGVSADGRFEAGCAVERMGLVTVVGQADATERHTGLGNFRRVVVKRPFKVVKITPPQPFDLSGLYIIYPEYMSDVIVAQLFGDVDSRYTAANGAKSALEGQVLTPVNNLVRDIDSKVKQFDRLYRLAQTPIGNHTIAPPPQWLRNVINALEGAFVHAATALDIAGAPESGRRPFMIQDAVFVARNTVPDDVLGDLNDFNYERNIRDKLEPIKGLMDKIQGIISLNNEILQIVAPVHAYVPIGEVLEAMRAGLTPISAGLAQTVYDVCYNIHYQILDPLLAIQNGVGQVLALLQKVLMEVSVMGQQSFAGFRGQISRARQGIIDQQINRNPNLRDLSLQGLPMEDPVTAMALGVPLPNYSLSDGYGGMRRGLDLQRIAGQAAEAFMNTLLSYVLDQVLGFIQQQIANLLIQVNLAIGCVASVGWTGVGYLACQAYSLVISAITRTIINELMRQARRLTSMKGDAIGALVGQLINQLPFLQDHPVLSQIRPPLGELAGRIIDAAFENRDISESVDQYLQAVLTNLIEQGAAVASSGVERYGGVLKGYVLRHRFRNLVEFDPAGVWVHTAYRERFETVYDERIWRNKATWIVRNQNDWEGLVKRYTAGHFIYPLDQSGDRTEYWRQDSYAPNEGYGLNGIILYEGTGTLTIDLPNFNGKLIVYTASANVKVQALRLRDRNKDTVTVICAKNVELPAGEVDVSVHAVGDQSKVDMNESTRIFGSLLIKRYRVEDQSDPHASLKGKLTYNAKLDATGTGAPGGIDANHTFVTVSPYVASREVQLTP